MQNATFKMQNVKFDIRHSIFNIRYSFPLLLSLLILPSVLMAQFTAGPDVTINPGVPVTLTARYGMIATPVNLEDNRVSPLYDIGFSFKFFGNIYTQFSIADNGWITFETNHTISERWAATKNIGIPSPGPYSPKNCILGAMEEYNPGIAGGPYIFYRTIGIAPSRKLVVMWCQCPMYICPDETVTFQIVLYEGDSIENHILTKPLCNLAGGTPYATTLGIQNDLGSNGFSVPGRNASIWSVNSQNPEGWKYLATSPTTYDIKSVPFNLVPITPGDKIIYRWYEGSSLEPFSWDSTVVVTPHETTTYKVTAVLCNGGTFDTRVTVNVVPDIPNAFAPNSNIPDNTKFRIKGLPAENITMYDIKIYNRWGQMVFTSSDINVSWDGTMNNDGVGLCPDGTYAWVIYYENVNKTKVTNKGSVTLLR